LNEALSKLTDDAARLDTTLKLVQLNWQLNNLEHFQRHFESMLNLLKKHSNSPYHGWALNVKGIRLFEQGDRAAAHTCFDRALKMDPHNSRFLINAAVLAHGVGKNREAALTATRAAKNDPNSAGPWHILGLLHLFTGKPEQAVQAVQKAIEHESNDPNLQYCLAICHAKNNQPEACEAQLAGIAASQNPLLSACRNILKGNLEDALSLLRQSLKSGTINSHQLLGDPNLHALVDTSTLMDMSAA
jgi:tetratricopeptide (TPR) repeat protein